MSSDELDVLEGYYLKGKAKKVPIKLFFWPTDPSLIDKIYFEKQGIPYHHPLFDEMHHKNKRYTEMIPVHVGVVKSLRSVVLIKEFIEFD